MKKILLIVLFVILTLFNVGCYVENKDTFYIDEVRSLTINVGDELTFTGIEYDINNDILITNNDKVYGNKPGDIVINTLGGKIYVTVLPEEIVLNVSCDQLLMVNETTKIIHNILPAYKNQNVKYESSDNDVIQVDSKGVITGKTSGLARVLVSSEEYNIKKEITIIVMDEDEKYYESLFENIVEDRNENINFNDNNKILEGIINYNMSSLVGISGYEIIDDKVTDTIFGAGIIYKTNTYFTDGTVKENTTLIDTEKEIKYFEYYVITNKHLIIDRNVVRVYLGENFKEVNAEVIEYDEKIDLAVLKFKSKYFFPVCKIGDSSKIQKGEFIISIGHGQAKQFYKTSTFGVISGVSRYVNTDTDGDGVNDWDSEYIQHDAALNECDSGGAIVNMKGEIIGINSTKIINSKYNNMSFAIPMNLVMEIVSQLEKGVRPKRATLGVQIIDVMQYWEDPEYFKIYYPTVNVPNEVKYGFYVTIVDDGGLAQKAGVQVNDIIVEFNGVEVKYSYLLRAELGKFLIGSGEIVEMKVVRNNQIITLQVQF